MLSVKQVVIKYHFLRLWYDSTWDWTPLSRTIGEHSTHKANESVTYTYICGNICNNNIQTSMNEWTHFLQNYTSHTLFAKGLRKGWCWVCVRGELETEQTTTYWTQVFLTIAALLPHSTGLLNRGPEGPSPLSGAGTHSAGNCDWNWPELQLNQTVCGTWLYNWLTSTCFMWASHLHRIQPVHRSRWYSDIFDRMHLLFTQVHLLIDGSVEGQYVTHIDWT